MKISDAVLAHVAIALAIMFLFGWGFSLLFGFFLDLPVAIYYAVSGALASGIYIGTETRDAIKGSGFGWWAMWAPCLACAAAWLLVLILF